MFTSYPIQIVNDHIIISDQQNLILDTGSPESFHPSGIIKLCGEDILVNTSLMGVSSDYLRTHVGANLDGIVGMDLIHRYPMLVDLRCGVVFIDDDAIYDRSFEQVELGPHAQGLIAVKMVVNNHLVRMIVDTGAPISYINESIVGNLESEGEKSDFHPLIGDFHTKTYRCEVVPVPAEKPYSQVFGVAPRMLSMTLAMLQVDGIIGIDLFKRYRIQIRDGKVFLPPQGI